NRSARFEEAAFTGLAPEPIHSATPVPVRFEMRREAGTVAFDGTFQNGRGMGEYRFTANRAYPDLVRRLGVPSLRQDQPEDRALFDLALFDVTTEFIRS